LDLGLLNQPQQEPGSWEGLVKDCQPVKVSVTAKCHLDPSPATDLKLQRREPAHIRKDTRGERTGTERSAFVPQANHSGWFTVSRN